MITNLKYWEQVEKLAQAVMELTDVIIAPIMEEYLLTHDVDQQELTSENVAQICREQYTPEENALWDNIEQISSQIANEHNTNNEQVSSDVWSIIAQNTSDSFHQYH